MTATRPHRDARPTATAPLVHVALYRSTSAGPRSARHLIDCTCGETSAARSERAAERAHRFHVAGRVEARP